MRPDLNDHRKRRDERLAEALSKAFIAAGLISIAVYVWRIVAGDTGMGGM